MGISNLKEQLKDIEGIANLTMRYDDKNHQIFSLGDGIEVTLHPQASIASIRGALINAIASKP